MNMTPQLIHLHAYSRGIRSVRIVKDEGKFLLVELPDGSLAHVYYSASLGARLGKFMRENNVDGVSNIRLFAKKHERGFITWEVERDDHAPIPRFLLKDEN